MQKNASSKDDTFVCQSTALVGATLPLPLLDVRQYVWDISSGTCEPLECIRMFFTMLRKIVIARLTGRTYSEVSGRRRRTPTSSLNLKPGELVEVKSKEEILATLDFKSRNRGLEFSEEMLKYCGKRYRVWKRCDKMIIEQTRKIRQIANTVILEGVTCDGKAHRGCQRTCWCMWREIWLKRVE
jgi:hypothetical protein